MSDRRAVLGLRKPTRKPPATHDVFENTAYTLFANDKFIPYLSITAGEKNENVDHMWITDLKLGSGSNDPNNNIFVFCTIYARQVSGHDAPNMWSQLFSIEML